MKLHVLILALVVFVSLSFGQTPDASPAPVTGDEDSPIKVDTLLINIPVIASDKNGRYTPGLTKGNFTITEDGEARPIDFFADSKAPMNVAILIDCSPSTWRLMPDIQDAARDFVKIIRPEDQALIAGFDSVLYLFSEFTSDQKLLKKGIDKAGIVRRSGSNMQDSIYSLLSRQFAVVQGRKAIIVLTDGMVAGRISNEKLLSLLAESDVLVYPILFENAIKINPAFIPETRTLPNGKILTREEAVKGLQEMENRQNTFMNSLGTVTGGRLYDSNSGNFKKIFQNIADELKNQYLVGFYPQNVNDGKKHRIVVEANPRTIVVRTKGRIQLKTPTQ